MVTIPAFHAVRSGFNSRYRKILYFTKKYNNLKFLLHIIKMSCINYIATFQEEIKGYVHFHQCKSDEMTKVEIFLSGFQPKKIHAIHIHEYGDMRFGCKSLGGHLNITNKNHGSIFIDPVESHTGDMINNFETDKNGRVYIEYHDPRLNLFHSTKKSIIGCSVVIHAGQDDFGLGTNSESKITGNAGERIACSIIGKMNPSM